MSVQDQILVATQVILLKDQACKRGGRKEARSRHDCADLVVSV